MAFQELEWHAVNDVDFDDPEADILEIVHENNGGGQVGQKNAILA